MADTLPDKLVIPSRSALIEQYKDDFAFHAEGVSTDAGTLVTIRATAIADMLLPIYTESFRQTETGTLEGKANAGQLDRECIARGIPTKLPAAGASGFVTVATSSGGGSVQVGDQLKDLNTGFRYQATVTGTFETGEQVAVTGIDTGKATNVAAGTQLNWVSPRAGMNGACTVFADSNGDGLTGGADEETPQEQIERIIEAAANPAAAGNDAAYQKAASETPGIAVEQAFTYPCATGPGVSCLLFLLRPSRIGGSRIPNNAQIGLVKGYVTGQMPKDDSVAYGVVLEEDVDVVLRVEWADGVASWTDGIPWPPVGSAGDEYTVQASPTPTALTFDVKTTTVDPAKFRTPQVGQVIALWDRATLTWRRKTILTVTGTNPWTLTIDPSNAASDGTFIPVAGALVSPWSDSLALVSTPIAQYFDTLGPGEQIDTTVVPFFDEGFRQKRSPANPQFWPSALTTKMLIPVEQLDSVNNVETEQPSLPLRPTVGTLGTSAYLLRLNQFAVYPDT